tara:strand:+ start:933 stop:2462 length:1530 start_codon:yes stop_codon:yes gene_type:complete
MKFFRKLLFVFILRIFNYNKNISYNDLNFKKIDFTNNKQVKSFIFKKDFHKIQNRSIQNFDFLNFSKKLGGKVGISLSRNTIINWYKINKNKINFPWSDDLTSKRLINIIYNYEFINSSSDISEKKLIDKIIFIHLKRVIYDFKYKDISQITSYDLIANFLSVIILGKLNHRDLNYLNLIIDYNIDQLGMHKSYNILEHSKFINNLEELKNIFLYFKIENDRKIDESLIKMKSILNEYYHLDRTFPLFNGTNNNFTEIIFNSLNKDEYLKSRSFLNTNNGIAFYSDKNKKLFFDVVQPNKDNISSNLSAGTLSFEFSSLGEKIITNCGASESFGKNPEYLRYSAAHSTIILQNTNISEIKENNPHLKYPQSVKFNSIYENEQSIFEGSHNGYIKKFNKIIKRRILINQNMNKIEGEDSIISVSNTEKRIIYHIRFHLMDSISFNLTNNKKNIILRSKLNNMWLFKSDLEVLIEDSILVDNNKTMPTKQIVIKGVASDKKQIRRWSLEKI